MGDVENDRMEGSYLFYVNPKLQALYQVIRYRVRFRTPTTEAERHYLPTEKLVWNAQPGRVHQRCFELVGAPGTLPQWREMSDGSDEYRLEMGMVMQLLGLHRTVLQERERR